MPGMNEALRAMIQWLKLSPIRLSSSLLQTTSVRLIFMLMDGMNVLIRLFPEKGKIPIELSQVQNDTEP